MLKHFRSRFSAEVEQLCLLAKLWFSTLIILKWIILNDNLIDYFYYSYSYYYYLYIYLFIIILIIILIFILCISVYFLLTYFTYITYFFLSPRDSVMTLKSGLEVTQSHWKWYHSTAWAFPVRISYSNCGRIFSRFDTMHERDRQPATWQLPTQTDIGLHYCIVNFLLPLVVNKDVHYLFNKSFPP